MSADTDATIDPFGWVGSVLDARYRIDRVVGAGGFGVVYAAHHIALGGPVAVKCLDLRSQLDPVRQQAFLKAFRDEGRILHQLASKAPAILRVMDLSAQTSPRGIWTPYLVLEWLDGVTLREFIDARHRAGARFTLEEVLDLLAPIARALETAHASDIAHRDVKPANIFVLASGELKILDFGIAKVMTDEAVVGSRYDVTGQSLTAFTPAYGAPEQFEPGRAGFGATGPWTDVYALALIVVEMLCGRRPYDGELALQFHRQAVNRQLRPTPSRFGIRVAESVERSLLHALAVDPRHRPASAEAFWTELKAAADAPAATVQLPGHAPPPVASPTRASTGPAPIATTTSSSVQTVRGRTTPRHNGLSVVLVGAVAMLGVGSIFYALTRATETASEEHKEQHPIASAPRIDKPTIGTRLSPTASLQVTSRASQVAFLGCDLRYWNMPSGTTIRLVWHVYDSDGDETNSTAGKEQEIRGNGIVNAYLQSVDGEFRPGTYECTWRVISDGAAEVPETSAKLRVMKAATTGEPPSGGGAVSAPKKNTWPPTTVGGESTVKELPAAKTPAGESTIKQ
jgi:serine/threonine-protein kinase